MSIHENYPLKKLNTFGIDVKTRYFASIENVEELAEFIHSDLLRKNKLLILGGGSNVLFTGNFDGVILKLNTRTINVQNVSDNEILVSAEAGVDWNDLIKYCIDQGFGGLENLSLIPGNVGAAPIQNIGAYGVEQEQLFYELSAMDLQTGLQKRFKKEECKFNYRDSVFKNELKGRYVITRVVYKLNRNCRPMLSYAPLKEVFKNKPEREIDIRRISEVVSEIRRSKLPDPEIIGNAGSFFKNPVISKNNFLKVKDEYFEVPGYELEDGSVKVPAAWLIEQCGWKGKRSGNAGVHSKQALVLVNYGGATGKEILSLSENIAKDVYSKFGIQLQREVNVIE